MSVFLRGRNRYIYRTRTQVHGVKRETVERQPSDTDERVLVPCQIHAKRCVGTESFDTHHTVREPCVREKRSVGMAFGERQINVDGGALKVER